MQHNKVQGWKAEELARLLNGRWSTTPPDDWFADDIALKTFDLKLPGRRYLLVAIDSDTWHKARGTWESTLAGKIPMSSSSATTVNSAALLCSVLSPNCRLNFPN